MKRASNIDELCWVGWRASQFRDVTLITLIQYVLVAQDLLNDGGCHDDWVSPASPEVAQVLAGSHIEDPSMEYKGLWYHNFNSYTPTVRTKINIPQACTHPAHFCRNNTLYTLSLGTVLLWPLGLTSPQAPIRRACPHRSPLTPTPWPPVPLPFPVSHNFPLLSFINPRPWTPSSPLNWQSPSWPYFAPLHLLQMVNSMIAPTLSRLPLPHHNHYLSAHL
jgi:hypothetical protein